MIDQELLSILACPRCRAELRLVGADRLVCQAAQQGCGLRYPIRDGIPILLIDEAEPADGAKNAPAASPAAPAAQPKD